MVVQVPSIRFRSDIGSCYDHKFDLIMNTAVFSRMKVQGGKVSGKRVDAFLRACSEAGQIESIRVLRETPISELCVGDFPLDDYCNKELERQLELLCARADGLFSTACCKDILAKCDFSQCARISSSEPLDIQVRDETDYKIPPNVSYDIRGWYSLGLWSQRVEVNLSRPAWNPVLQDIRNRCVEKVSDTIQYQAATVVERLLHQSLERCIAAFQQQISDAIYKTISDISALHEERESACKLEDSIHNKMLPTVYSLKDISEYP